MWGVSAALLAWSSAKIRREGDERQIPLMGVLGAFVFAAQMVNFAIPGTGSSGHLGGGLLLAVLLGPAGAFLTISSVLLVQALFFADGGLLALGCNIFNLGFFPAFIAYPFLYRPLARAGFPLAAALLAAAAGLLAGAFCVVLETVLSGVAALPFLTFLLLMLPVHLAIGLVEGGVTGALLSFIRRARPDILAGAEPHPSRFPLRGVAISFLAASLVTAGGLSWFASQNPDGLEWSMARITGRTEIPVPATGVHGALAAVQGKTAFLNNNAVAREPAPPVAVPEQLPAGKGGAAGAGIAGSLLTLAVVFSVAAASRRKRSF